MWQHLRLQCYISPDCDWSICYLQVVSVADGMPSWVCEVAVQKPTVREAIEFVKQIERDIEFPIRQCS